MLVFELPRIDILTVPEASTLFREVTSPAPFYCVIVVIIASDKLIDPLSKRPMLIVPNMPNYCTATLIALFHATMLLHWPLPKPLHCYLLRYRINYHIFGYYTCMEDNPVDRRDSLIFYEESKNLKST